MGQATLPTQLRASRRSETFAGVPAAALFIDRSERIAQGFRLGRAFHRGQDMSDIAPLRAGAAPDA